MGFVVRFVVVPGVGGSEEDHWQTRWEQEWGADAVRIVPRSWDAPDHDDWADAVDRAVRSLDVARSEVVVVGHSLGCWAATEWLAGTSGSSVRAMMLVAPPDPAGTAFAAAAGPTFARVRARPLACPSVVVASTNDPYCPVGEAERLAAGWGSDLRIVGARGHLNAASGLGVWQEGRGLLELLLSR
ncbi:putative alpha/beta hydrolase family esterase [Microbacterium proteolyticum]|nr:putative alpha/beta hydrolase family esterase [Microbacterium sp. SORGH_AS_0344]MDQ1170369.1 putative alpha/beta hydrolase family esterase [Microbacterium proteolyticum]